MLEHESTPIFSALKEYIKEDVIPFDVPGHKNGVPSNELREYLGEEIFKFDVNSKINLDNLINPTGVIKDAQKLMANAFGVSEALLLVNGTTIGIQTMIMSVCKPGDRIIIPRNVHKSVLNALILCGIIPVYVEPEISHEYGIFLNIHEKKIMDAIRENSDCKAILLINPTYYGVTTNIKPIIDEAHKNNMIVLVDEAHGSHFYFNDKFPNPAMKLDADISCVSLHKTGGSLTQSSVLLINAKRVDAKKVKTTLNILQTTSASYILMSSLDVARKELVLKGNEKLDKVLDLSIKAREGIKSLGSYSILDETDINRYNMGALDISKLCICVKGIGISGFEAVNILRTECKIQMELGDMYNILAIISLGDSEENIDKLISGLKYIKDHYENSESLNYNFEKQKIPKAILTPREAYFMDKKYIAVEDSVGKISGDTIIIYPPGIPIVSLGEEINKEIAQYILDMIKQKVEVIGIINGEIAVVKDSLS